MKPLFSIIGKAKLWVWISLVWMIACVALFITHQRYSVQFTGGIEISTSGAIANPENLSNDIQALVTSVSGTGDKITSTTNYNINSAGNTDMIVQVDVKDDEKVSIISQAIKSELVSKKYITDESKITKFGIVWPSLGEYIKSTAKSAVIWWLILMTIYMIFAFMGVRKQVSPAILAAITVFTMLFDILTPAGVYGIMMSIDPTMQIDVIFIIAILTTMGYSINDTVIIFDRIRENLEKAGNKWVDYEKIFEDSLRQTMKRSLGTAISVLLVVIAMYVFGHGDLARFAFTMMIWVIGGSFSSIFLAAPLAYLIIKYQHKNTK